MPQYTCQWCTTPIRQPVTGRTRHFCDGTCRQAAYRAGRLAQEYPEAWPTPGAGRRMASTGHDLKGSNHSGHNGRTQTPGVH
jgi:hypothetical protein